MARLASGPRLRGRDRELRALGEALDRAASGGSAIVLVKGEAGIGKTSLLAETLEQARARSLRVAAGRAEELERTRPFGLLADTLGCVRSSSDPRRAAIAALLAIRTSDQGPMTVSGDPGLQFQAVDAFLDLVEALALQRPLVVGVDDLQWPIPPACSRWARWGGAWSTFRWRSSAASGRLRTHMSWSAPCWPSMRRGRNGCRWASSTSGPWSNW